MESIDIFDTALFRQVYRHADLFIELEAVNGPGFAAKRIEAEHKAALSNPFYTLDDIYSFLPGVNRYNEFAAELDGVYANPDVLTMYNTDPENYVFISDMYLPSFLLECMLTCCGYCNPRVIVSCEARAWKNTGELFKTAASVFGKITAHLDDNYACVEGAIKAGIKGRYYKKDTTYAPDISSRFKKYLSENTRGEASYRFGYMFAPLVFEVTRWVMSFGKRVHFLARDGYLPFQIAPAFGDDSLILYTSRLSLAIASLDTSVPLDHERNAVAVTILTFAGTDLSDEAAVYKRAEKARNEALRYLENKGLEDGDILFDVGYTGNQAYYLERITGKRFACKFVQISARDIGLDREQFLPRYVIGTYFAVLEQIFCAPFGSTIGYKKGNPVIEDIPSSELTVNSGVISGVLAGIADIDKRGLSFSPSDLADHLEDFLTNPQIEFAEFMNGIEFRNLRDEETRSIVGFSCGDIEAGYLAECYSESLWPPAFNALLRKHYPELSGYILPRSNAEYVCLESVRSRLETLCHVPGKFSFYGAGTLLDLIFQLWPDLAPRAVIDRNAETLKEFRGISLITDKKAFSMAETLGPVYVAVLHNTEKLASELREKGLDARKLH